jgi:hypothetical protein
MIFKGVKGSGLGQGVEYVLIFYVTIIHFNNKGVNSLRCTKILSQRHIFLSFLSSLFLPCKITFMDDYDGIYNCNGLEYNPFEIFDNF